MERTHLLSLLLSQEVSVLVVGSLNEGVLGPHGGVQEAVTVANGSESGLDEVTKSAGGTTGRGVAIGNTSKLKNLLGSRSSNDTSTTGSRDQTGDGGTALASKLARNSVGLTEGRSPVTATNRDDSELGKDDGTTNSSGNFLGALDTETDVTVTIANNDESLETGALTSTGLLLDRGDLHDLVLELGKEVINNLVFLDGKGEKIDFLNGLDLAILNETTELGNGNPRVRGKLKHQVLEQGTQMFQPDGINKNREHTTRSSLLDDHVRDHHGHHDREVHHVRVQIHHVLSSKVKALI